MTTIDARTAGLKAVQTNLVALRAALQKLRDPSSWAETQTVESANPATVSVARTGGAAPGGSTINVLRLAAGEQRTYAFTAPAADSSLTIGSTQVDLKAGASLDDAAKAINATTDAPVYATAVGGKLVLSARSTGAGSAFSASGDSLVEDVTKARVGADAQYTVDGGAVRTASSNVVTDALAGVSMTLRSLGSTAVTVGAPGVDMSALKARVQSVVDSYNAVIGGINAEITTKPIANPTRTSDAGHGVLFGDRQLATITTQLRRAVSDPLDSTSMLSSLGISTGAASTANAKGSDAVLGKLSIDTTKLTDALTANPVDARKLINGIADRVEKIVSGHADTGGSLAARITSGPEQSKRLQATIDRDNDRIDSRAKALKAKFAAMEKAMASSNNQSSWLSAQISKL